MSKIRSVVELYTLVVLMLPCVSCCTMGDSARDRDNITIIKKLDRSMTGYKGKGVYLEVLNADMIPDPMRSGRWVVAVESDIGHTLRALGIETNFIKKDTPLWVECLFNLRLGLPRVGRNFKIQCKYFSVVNIRLTDAATGIVIGEVGYKRPWYADYPGSLFEEMLIKLVDSYKANSNGNPDKKAVQSK